MAGNYGRTSGTGSLGSSAYRNDDDTQLQDLPNTGYEDWVEKDAEYKKEIGKAMR